MRDIVQEQSCPRCQKCDRWRNAPEYIRDPWVLWDRFPCPPPGTNKARILIELDWTGQLGTRDGCKALRRVAARCKVDLNSVNLLPNSLHDCDELFTVFGICGTQCVIAIILACICLLFVFILAIVCYRYVRRNDKESSTTFTKVLTTDQTALNTHLNRYYVQSQYYYRAGNIPDRRGLPFEARTSDNGVEARLIKAIQQVPVQAYPVEDVCSQCLSPSRHSTLSNGRSRHGYERIYWKDRDCVPKRVPSNDSLIHRKQLDRHRSTAGSSSDMSHFYDYISDNNPYDAYNGRRSNHSNVCFTRNGSINLHEVPNYGDPPKYSDDERGFMLPRLINKDLDYRDGTPTRQEIVPSRASMDSRGGCNRSDINNYHGSLSDHYNYTDNGNDARMVNDSIINNTTMELGHGKNKSSKSLNTDIIKGYKYTYNPSFDDETTTTSKPEYDDASTSPDTPSECVEFEVFSNNADVRDNMIIASPNVKMPRQKKRTSSLQSKRNSETTSLSDTPAKSTSGYPTRINGSLQKGNTCK